MRFDRIGHRAADHIAVGILDQRRDIGIETKRDPCHRMIEAGVDNAGVFNTYQAIFKLLAACFATMHVAYGVGSLTGAVGFWRRWGHVGREPAPGRGVA